MEDLKNLYKDPALPGSFGGINSLRRATKGRVKTKDISSWLTGKDSYTLNKPLKRKFQRNRVIVGGIDEQFQADLLDLQSLSKFNNGFKYLLTCIDIFSKYAWAIPLKDKKGSSVVKGFQKIFQERVCTTLQTDDGSEFLFSGLQKYLKELNIHFFTTKNETKASVIERFHRTLMSKVTRYFTEYNTRKYIDVIDKLIYSYNHTWHRSIKTEPALVNIDNQAVVWENLYGDLSKNEKKSQFHLNDTVRISKLKGKFEKGYKNNWSREIFTIHQIINRNPIVYKLKDLAGEIIEGTFYEKEIQKVTDSGYYPVEKVIKKRKKGTNTEYFVKFEGYPEKFNAWVSDVKTI